ncbi:hypothetical protein HJ590_08890 [Naumannella sp. ID2617S]|nr:hypothetical protein [Naumannella sp. ID2617S]
MTITANAGPLVPEWVYADSFPQADEEALDRLSAGWASLGEALQAGGADVHGTARQLATEHRGEANEAAGQRLQLVGDWLGRGHAGCTSAAESCSRAAVLVRVAKLAMNLVLQSLVVASFKTVLTSAAKGPIGLAGAAVQLRQLQVVAQARLQALARALAERLGTLAPTVQLAPSPRPTGRTSAAEVESKVAALGGSEAHSRRLAERPEADPRSLAADRAFGPDQRTALDRSAGAVLDRAVASAGTGAAPGGDGPLSPDADPWQLSGLAGSDPGTPDPSSSAPPGSNPGADPFGLDSDSLLAAAGEVTPEELDRSGLGPAGDRAEDAATEPGDEAGTSAAPGPAGPTAPATQATAPAPAAPSQLPDISPAPGAPADPGPGTAPPPQVSASTPAPSSGPAPSSEALAARGSVGDGTPPPRSQPVESPAPVRHSGHPATAAVSPPAAPGVPAPETGPSATAPVPSPSHHSQADLDQTVSRGDLHPTPTSRPGTQTAAWAPAEVAGATGSSEGIRSGVPGSTGQPAPAPGPGAPSGLPIGGPPGGIAGPTGSLGPLPSGPLASGSLGGGSLGGGSLGGGSLGTGSLGSGTSTVPGTTGTGPMAGMPPGSGSPANPGSSSPGGTHPGSQPGAGHPGAAIQGQTPPGQVAAPGGSLGQAGNQVSAPGRETAPKPPGGANEVATLLATGGLLGTAFGGPGGFPTSDLRTGAGFALPRLGPDQLRGALPSEDPWQMVYQKTLRPGEAEEFLSGQRTTLRGLIHPAHQVNRLATPAQHFDVLGLGFGVEQGEGRLVTPFHRDATWIDVLRCNGIREEDLVLPVSEEWTGMSAGCTPVVRNHRSPWTGTGYAPGSDSAYPIEEYELLGHLRVAVPHGAEIWRRYADGHDELLGTHDATTGFWNGRPGAVISPHSDLHNGKFATVEDRLVPVQEFGPERVVLLTEPRQVVSRDRISGLTGLTTIGTWGDARVQVLRSDGAAVLVDYLGDSLEEAEQLGFVQLNQGEWEPRWLPDAAISNRSEFCRSYA